MTYTATSTDTNFAADDALNPLALETWNITQETDSFKVFTKSEAFKTTFGTRSRWRGTATYIMERPTTGIITSAGRNMEIRGDGVVAHKQFVGTFVTGSGEVFTGTALVVGLDTDCPLDGPDMVNVTFKGDGELTYS
jgi:hypothetical protein